MREFILSRQHDPTTAKVLSMVNEIVFVLFLELGGVSEKPENAAAS